MGTAGTISVCNREPVEEEPKTGASRQGVQGNRRWDEIACTYDVVLAVGSQERGPSHSTESTVDLLQPRFGPNRGLRRHGFHLSSSLAVSWPVLLTFSFSPGGLSTLCDS